MFNQPISGVDEILWRYPFVLSYVSYCALLPKKPLSKVPPSSSVW